MKMPGSSDVIVVAGGRDANETVLTSVEFFVNGAWIQSLQTCEWIEMEQKLSADRYGHNSLLISEGHGALSCL